METYFVGSHDVNLGYIVNESSIVFLIYKVTKKYWTGDILKILNYII